MEDSVNNMLTKEEVFEIISMASQLYSNYTSVFSPFMSKQNLENLNNNPKIPSSIDEVDYVLKNYTVSSETAKAFNEFAEVYDLIFKRTINYYSSLLSFDLDYVCVNAYSTDDYNSKEYEDDLKRVIKFFDNFDYKREFKKVLHQILIHESYFVWFRDSRGNIDSTGEISVDDDVKTSTYTLQMMPQKYCLITGEWSESNRTKGLLYDFDMNYFLKAGVDIMSFDPIFRKKYDQIFNGKNQKYNPTSSLNKRTGEYALWVQTSPNQGAYCFKLNEDNFNETPFLTPFIKHVLTNDEVEKLQKDMNMLAARGLLVGEIPLLDRQQSGQVEDAMAWKPKTLQKFLTLVKMGLTNNLSTSTGATLNAVAMPTEETDFYQFKNENTDMLVNQYKTANSLSASASRIVYSYDKASQSELEAQIYNDYMFVRKVYGQFESFLNLYVNKKTNKYKFRFILDGCPYPSLKKIDKDNMIELADRGIILHAGSYAKILNLSPFDFERMIKEGIASEWTTKLTSQLVSIHTQTASENSTGRPEKNDLDLKDSGSVSREYTY